MDKWLRGATLTSKERKYYWLVKAEYLYKGQLLYEEQRARRRERPEKASALTPERERILDFYNRALDAGDAALIKGFLQKPLTPQDIYDLRTMRVLENIQSFGHRTDINVPLFMSIDPRTVGTGNYMPHFLPGDTFPAQHVIPLQAALKSPHYSDTWREDRCEPLKRCGVLQYLLRFQGYKYETVEGGHEVAVPGSLERVARYERIPESEFITMPDAFENGRPLLLIMTDFVDLAGEDALDITAYLQDAYGSQVAIRLVEVTQPDATWRTPLYFQKSFEDRPGQTFHERYAEDHAFQAKAGYVTYPFITAPCLLDNNSHTVHNLYRHAGNTQGVLLDRENKMVYQTGYGHYYWSWSDFAADVAWLNDLEEEIVALLKNDGRRVPGRPSTVNVRRNYRVRAGNSSKTEPGVKQTTAHIARFKPSHRTGGWSEPAYGHDPDGINLAESRIVSERLNLLVDENTRIVVDGVTRTNLADLASRSDGWLHVRTYDTSDRACRNGKARCIFYNTDESHFIWRSGIIKSVEKTGDSYLATVSMEEADPQKMFGYRFIEEAGAERHLYGKAKIYYETMQRWVKQSEGRDPMYTFAVDVNTEIFVNGKESPPEALKPGQFAGVQYETIAEGAETIWPMHIRATEYGNGAQ
ncbi:MAG: hypothetical protein GF418_02390 [Chitinivibrionales bacterium]|nr:hypothetical protein [Chitinivibrionales bacterium]